MGMLRLVRLFFRPAGLDFADMGAGIFSGIADQYAAHTLPQYRMSVGTAAPIVENNWLAALQAIQEATSQGTGAIDPVLLDSYSKMLGVDLSGLIGAGAAAGAQYGNLANTAGGFGNTMTGQAAGAFGRGADIWNTARDPQNQLHDYLLGQTIDQSRAADSARGIGMGGVSVGNEQDATRKFEMDWQNQQLGRQIAGGQAANAAGMAGAQDLSGAMGYYGMQPEFTMQAGTVPTQTNMFAAQYPMQAATQFGAAWNQNAVNPWMQIQGQDNPYLGMAQSEAQNHSMYDYNLALARAGLTNQAIGEFNTGYRGQSGVGNPMNWVGMGG